MERIIVIGNSGGGKSVLARKLAAKHTLPYSELDAVLWRSGWKLAPDAEYDADHARLIAEPRWVLDGLGRADPIPARLARATAVVLIDLPLWLHFTLAAERQVAWALGRLEHPPAGQVQMPPTKGLFKTIWEVDQNWLPELRRLVGQQEAQGKRVYRLTSIEALDGFVA